MSIQSTTLSNSHPSSSVPPLDGTQTSSLFQLKKPWAPEENELLGRLLKRHQFTASTNQPEPLWTRLLEEFRAVFPDRQNKSIQCHVRDRWSALMQGDEPKEGRNHPWSSADRELLLKKIKEYAGEPNVWDRIGNDLGRTSASVRLYYSQKIKPTLSKKQQLDFASYLPSIKPPANILRSTSHPGVTTYGWDDEQACVLIKIVTNQQELENTIDWTIVRDVFNCQFPHAERTPRQLRAHWDNTLQYKVEDYLSGKREGFYIRTTRPWSEEEKQCLQSLLEKHKGDWGAIQRAFKEQFPDTTRTLNQIKCRSKLPFEKGKEADRKVSETDEVSRKRKRVDDSDGETPPNQDLMGEMTLHE